MPVLNKTLENFVVANKMKGKGAICVALVVTRHAKKMGLPLNPTKLLTEKNGQVLGLGKGAVQAILRDHKIMRVLAEEGGRTSRGSIGNMQAYVEYLNKLAKTGAPDLDAIENWWIEQVKKFFEAKPMVFRLDAKSSLRSVIRDLLKQAEDRQKQDAGTMFLGAVLQHLVGAKLELVLGHEVEAHGAFVADSVTDSPGDYQVEDVVIHVTTSPGEALLRKCADNLGQGLRPLVITTFKNVPVAETMAENAGVAGRVEFFDVEQFVASNILELSKFKAAGRKVTVQDLIARYNRLAECENNPGLLIKGT
ncbi:MAG: DUF4928 family protein [bacterium]